ncbi:uncharacterized protein KD926_001593 [Aspergillus affinis]|uniref:uncharacterized protein n=1 Tax=Aspergillus affinis TaxID=1070780 RepID=UPI0022FF4080|nr:uncharacterized protein KD926_001593 [Aspergillus affinis]KAI9036640.1 hypothetical protein KD926_001593 [Aspergillus affinis]
MRGRKVALLLDNFSAHETTVKAIQREQYQLQNTQIFWLPANPTSRYQPLNQGIIQNFKTYYRRYWVNCMLQEYDAGRNPLDTITVLKTIRWTIYCWQEEVSVQTISDCFEQALSAGSRPYFDPYAAESENEDNEVPDPLPPRTSIEEDFALIEKLQTHEEQQPDGSKEFLRAMQRYRKLLWDRRRRLKVDGDVGRDFGAF